MNLGFDARMLVGKWKHRGIGGYISSLLKPLEKDEIIGLVPNRQTIDEYKYISKGFSFFPIWEQLLLPFYINILNTKYFLYPSITAPIFNFKKAKKILIVYDLIFMIPFSKLPASRSMYNNFGRIYRRLIFPFVIKSADHIISISEFTKNELHNKFNIPLNKIYIIPCSITTDWFVETIIPSSERKKYLITVSGDAPSKNLYQVLKAMSILKKQNSLNKFQLRVVGIGSKSKRKYESILKKYDIENDVILEKFLSKIELQKLYSEAWASLSLSLYEGFGVPIVEAMASGTPVICSNTTSMPEVAGNSAILVNPNSLEDILNAIKNIINIDEDKRNIMAYNGFINASKYNESNVNFVIEGFWNTIKY